MHELAICGSIAEIVERRAAGRRVETVHLRIGQLRQVVPDTLAFCWGLLGADTDLDGSVLEIEQVPARINCHACGREAEVGAFPVFVCVACHGVDVEVTAGEELLVTALDLARG